MDRYVGPCTDATICDASTVDFAGLADRLDPLRTVVFVSANGESMPGHNLVGGFLHVAPRTAVAVELRRFLVLLG